MSTAAAASSGPTGGGLASDAAAAPSSSAGTSLSPAVGAGPALTAVMNTTHGLLAQIQKLKQDQADARKVRQKIAKDLRNAQRRKRRLKTRARMLTNDDLVAVLLMRQKSGAAEDADVPVPEPLAGPEEPREDEPPAADD